MKISKEDSYLKVCLDINTQDFINRSPKTKPQTRNPLPNSIFCFLGYFYLEMEKRRQLGKINIECLISNVAHHFHFKTSISFVYKFAKLQPSGLKFPSL